ncbi:MAG TPA: YceI family protein [Caulobacteraceae bacterium]|jgi:polyisoprenoid-binding protein YceI|nr:YceI family protein [Caulobacteraceae bacterium]
MRIFTAVITSLFLLTLPAVADAANWAVDQAHSRIGFRATQEDAGFEGYFRSWNAAISFDPKRLATSHVTVNIALASAVTGNKDRDAYLPTADWFDARRFPSASFTAAKFVDKGAGHYEAIGDLSIKGIKRQVMLPFTLAITGNTAKMSGDLVLDRTWFNVGAGKWKDPAEVGTKVTVVVTVVARAAR